MSEDNGIWISNKNDLSDYVADFLQNWLEDNISDTLLNEMKKVAENLPTSETFKDNVLNKFEGYLDVRLKSFEEQYNKLQTAE